MTAFLTGVFTTILITFTTLRLTGCVQTVNIGIFLERGESQLKVPIRNAIYRNNYSPQNIQLTTSFEIVKSRDNFKSSKTFCNLLEDNTTVAILVSSKASPLIQSLCSNLQIPYIQTHWAERNNYLKSETFLNFHPDSDLLAQGLGAIVKSLQWRSFLILYENNDSLIRLKEILRLKNVYEKNAHSTVIVKKLLPGTDQLLILKQVKYCKVTNIILDCNKDKIADVLLQAKEMGLMKSLYSYFLTSLDSFTVDFKSFNTNVNITNIRLFNPTQEIFGDLVRLWGRNERLHGRFNTLDPLLIETETVIMHDAISSLIDSIKYLDLKENVQYKNTSCKGSGNFVYGPRIISSIKHNPPDYSLTGPLEFDSTGKRINFTIYVNEAKTGILLATWNPENQRNVNFVSREGTSEVVHGREIIVASKLGEPYLMEASAKDPDSLARKNKFKGYIVDLLDAIANITEFKFVIQLSEKYGGLIPETEEWDGMIGDVLNNKAHIAVADLTTTPSREKYVDFSMPFMRLGVGVLYKKGNPDNRWLAFLDPFTLEVWTYSATLYLMMNVVLYFIARMAPGDWENPHPCDQNPESLENIWGIKNCLWLTLGSIMNQGCDILPKGISSRLVASMWWIFALIMTSSYTASLAAFLTTNKMLEIKSVEDLAKQNRIKYGAVSGGATMDFLNKSTYSPYKRMLANMILSTPTVLERSNSEGIRRVQKTKDGLYAFLMESTNIDYIIERHCELQSVKKLIIPRSYAIAMRRHSPFADDINYAILKLQEDGYLITLRNKWWKETLDGPPCTVKEVTSKLTLDRVGGIFIVLGIGVSVGLLLGVLEFLNATWKICVKKHISYWEAFKSESMFALNVWISKKRTKATKTEPSQEITKPISKNTDDIANTGVIT